MKKYLLPREGKFYKANMHCHTNISDGKNTPEEIKAAFKEKGYSIVAFTDHEIMIPHTDLADEDFLPITAYEIQLRDWNTPPNCLKLYHMNVYSPDPDRYLSKTSDTSPLSETYEIMMFPISEYTQPPPLLRRTIFTPCSLQYSRFTSASRS